MGLSSGSALNLQEAGGDGVKFRIGSQSSRSRRGWSQVQDRLLIFKKPEGMESSSGSALNLQEAGGDGVKFRVGSQSSRSGGDRVKFKLGS
jgi:hypothetical protein